MTCQHHQAVTPPSCRLQVKKACEGKLMDVILHDGAPNVGGVFSKEMYNQVRLSPLDLACGNERGGAVERGELVQSLPHHIISADAAGLRP
jgi:23S rRNA U2552 (ribose-2'-O)-methylase RlmE/FtsJ